MSIIPGGSSSPSSPVAKVAGIPSSATWEDLRLPTAERSFSLSSLSGSVASPKNQVPEPPSKSVSIVSGNSEQERNMQKSRSQKMTPISKPEDRKNSGRSKTKGTDAIEGTQTVDEALKYRALYTNMVSSNLFLLQTLSKVISTSDVEEMCACAGKILNKEQSSELIKALIEYEVSVTESEKTLFRRNSMASKYLTVFSTKYGNLIVQKTFSALIKEVNQKKSYYEINPSRLKSESEIASNQKKLTKLSERFLEAISTSDANFSTQLKFVCRHLKNYVDARFPGRGLIAIGGFVCLRLFCPAVLDPTALGIVDSLSTESQRTLTLVAKILQNIANGVYFKESYMQPLNSLIDRYTKPLQTFFERLLLPCNPSDDEPEVVDIDKEIPSLIFLHRQTVANLSKMEAFITSMKMTEDQQGCAMRFHELEEILNRLGPPAEIPVQSPLLSLPRSTWDSTAEIETEERRDERFQKQFNLNSTESVLYEFPCAHERKIPVHGRMYISHNCFCFFAKVFAFKTTFVILVDDVVSIERDSTLPSAIEILTKEKSYLFSGIPKLAIQLEMIKGHWVAMKKRVESSVPSTDVVIPEQEENKEENAINAANTAALTEADWRLFLEGAKSLTRLRDEVIIAEGEHSHSLYQVAKGAVRVEKKVTNENGTQHVQVLRRMELGEIFGEISFLEGNTASASVVADDEEVEVYVVDGAFVDSLMVTNPGFAGRFYRFLAINLARRLVAPKMSNPPPAKPLDANGTQLSTPSNPSPSSISPSFTSAAMSAISSAPTSGSRSSRSSRTSWSATTSMNHQIVPLSKNLASPRSLEVTKEKEKEKEKEKDKEKEKEIESESEGSGTGGMRKLRGSKKYLPNGELDDSTPLENPATVKLRTRSRSHSSSQKDEPESTRSSGFRQRFSISLGSDKDKDKDKGDKAEKDKAEKERGEKTTSSKISSGSGPAIGMRMPVVPSSSAQYNSIMSASTFSSSSSSSASALPITRNKKGSSAASTVSSPSWTSPSLPSDSTGASSSLSSASSTGSAILSTLSGSTSSPNSSSSSIPTTTYTAPKSGSQVSTGSHVHSNRNLSPSKKTNQQGSHVRTGSSSSGKEEESGSSTSQKGSRVEKKTKERDRSRERDKHKKKDDDSHSKNRFRSLTEKIVNNIK